MKSIFLILSLLVAGLLSAEESTTIANTGPSDSTIFVSEEISLPLPVSRSKILFSISGSGKTAQEASGSLEISRKKAQSLLENSPISVINRTFSGGSGAGSAISQSTPILITEEIISMVSEDALNRMLDGLLSLPQTKITDVRSSKDNLYELKNKASSQAVKLAYAKAKQITSDQNLSLGEITDISLTEEPTATSIRDQLETSQAGNVENIREIKIVASLRIKIKAK